VATDPIEMVREYEHDTPYDLDLQGSLTELAALPPSTEAPYLSISLDWRPAGEAPGRSPAPEPLRSQRRSASHRDAEGASRRPSRQEMDDALEPLLASFPAHTPAHESVSADIERIRAYLDEELDPAAQGVFIVACSAADVFQTLTLSIPVPTGVRSGPTPSLGTLVRLIDDHPTYAVLVADQRDATLTLIAQAAPLQGVTLEASGYPRKQMQGGWSQRRYQQRADERIEAFAKGIADEVQRALDDASVTVLIVAGDEVITSALDGAFHQTVKERIIDTIRLDVDAGDQEIIETTLPIVEKAERERELAVVQAVQNAVGAGGRGAAGPEATLTALQAGQVMNLVMNDDFATPGWADYTLPVYGVGEVPAEHPAGGDNASIVSVALEDELIRLALQTGATIDVVRTSIPVDITADDAIPEAGSPPPRTEAAQLLDVLGGVGATLRFILDEDQPVGEM
jgi:hypothetical protein